MLRIFGRTTVHPHACGDNDFLAVPLARYDGSPPRVWGQHPHHFVHIRLVTVHPHACGDNRVSFAKAFGGVGSPPRVWGQRAFSSASRSISTVHPHACGDNSRRRTAAIRFIGSPPRVWGQHLPHPVAQVGYRFTPTRVGTTSAQFADTAPSTVHPHACGDNARSAPESAPPGGSPPRVWGQRSVMIIVLPTSRFTPTRVGTTYLAACQLRGPAGSPPRVWGQRSLLRPQRAG